MQNKNKPEHAVLPVELEVFVPPKVKPVAAGAEALAPNTKGVTAAGAVLAGVSAGLFSWPAKTNVDLDSLPLPNTEPPAVVVVCPNTKGTLEGLVDALELPNKVLELAEVFVGAALPNTLLALDVFTEATLPKTMLELVGVPVAGALPKILLEPAGVFEDRAPPNILLEPVGAVNEVALLNTVLEGAGVVPAAEAAVLDCTALPNTLLKLV